MAVEAVVASDMEALGKRLRRTVPPEVHAGLPSFDRDPVALLDGQNQDRIQNLVPVRWGRMLQTPFAFYRGSAALMASDLSHSESTGLELVICGDAHLDNFGLYASPERRLVFDLNDFDEAGLGPWEWDLKRLATSVVLAARQLGEDPDQIRTTTMSAIATYRLAVTGAADLGAIDRYFFSVDEKRLQEGAGDKTTRKLVERTVRKAQRRTSDRAMDDLVTTSSGGQARIAEQPPLIVHIEGSEQIVTELAAEYRTSLRADTALLVSQFRLSDSVLKVVGVGSVGTRCMILLMVGPSGEPLFLQVKEAGPSVLQAHGGVARALPEGVPQMAGANHAFRVVSAQRVLQAQSDPFLGWIRAPAVSDGVSRDYYVRQFRDMKGSFDIAKMDSGQFRRYSEACAVLLARAHAQSPLMLAVAAYVEDNQDLDDAFATWSVGYADQAERDHKALAAAARSGRIEVVEGL